MLILAYRISTNSGQPLPSAQSAIPDRNAKEFFQKEVQPLIAREEQRNREALLRAKALLDVQFAMYVSRLPSFAEELTTWGMRYEITKAAITGWWSKENHVRKIATDKFSEKVLSEKELEMTVRRIVLQFQNDLHASRNQMLAEATVRLKAANFEIPSLDVSEAGLDQALDKQMKPLVEKLAVESPAVGLLAFGGSLAAEEGVRLIVIQAIRGLVASLATTAATSGGATVTGGIAGGGTGTILGTPGVGTAIGFAVGIGLGVAFDSWMSGKFQEKVIDECGKVLETMKSELWSEPAHGFQVVFSAAVTTTSDTHSAALGKIITGSKQ